MVNTFNRLMEDKLKILQETNELNNKAKGIRNTARKIGNLAVRLKKLNYQIEHFGQKHNLVMVTIKFNSGKEQVFFLTGVTEMEAVSFYKNRFTSSTISIDAITIPLNQPFNEPIK